MKEEKVKIGIAGCGWIAEHAHIPALLKNKKAVIKAVFDTDLDRAHKIGCAFSISKAFCDFQQFLACGLDGIIIATPNYTHVAYTLEALKHKVSVLCEKPVALKASEIEEIIKLSKENQVVYIPGFVNRWRQDIKTMYDIIRSEKLGNIMTVDAGWIRKSGVPRPGTWFTNREYAGGGVLTDLGSHIIDICCLFLGTQKPISYQLKTAICSYEKVQRKGAAGWFQYNDTNQYEMNVEDTAIACVEFEGQVTMNVKLSWLAPIEADCTYVKVKGTKGQIELKALFGFSNERLWKEDLLECDYDGIQKTIHFNGNENHTRYAFNEMLSYFVDAVAGQSTGFTDGRDALMTVSLIENLYKNEMADEESALHMLMEEI